MNGRRLTGSINSREFPGQFNPAQPDGTSKRIADGIWRDAPKARAAMLLVARACNLFEQMAVVARLPAMPGPAARRADPKGTKALVDRWKAFVTEHFIEAIEQATSSMNEDVKLNSYVGSVALTLHFQVWELGELLEYWYHDVTDHLHDEVVSQSAGGTQGSPFCVTKTMWEDPEDPDFSRRHTAQEKRKSAYESLFGGGAPTSGAGNFSLAQLLTRRRGADPIETLLSMLSGEDGPIDGDDKQRRMDDVTESLLASILGPAKARNTRRFVEAERAAKRGGATKASDLKSKLAERLGIDPDEFVLLSVGPGGELSSVDEFESGGASKLEQVLRERLAKMAEGPDSTEARFRTRGFGHEEERSTPAESTRRPVSVDDRKVDIKSDPLGHPVANAVEVPLTVMPTVDGATGAAPNFPPAPSTPAPEPTITRLSTPNVVVPPSPEG